MPKITTNQLEERVNNMKESNSLEHGAINDLLSKIAEKIDNLDKKFVTRWELAIIMTLILPIISMIIAKVVKAN